MGVGGCGWVWVGVEVEVVEFFFYIILYSESTDANIVKG